MVTKRVCLRPNIHTCWTEFHSKITKYK